MKKLTLIIIIYLISSNAYSDKLSFLECFSKANKADISEATYFCYSTLPNYKISNKDSRIILDSCYKEIYLNNRKKFRDSNVLKCKDHLTDLLE